MASVSFYLKDPECEVPTSIYMYLSYDGKRTKFSTREKILPKYWHKEDQLVRKSSKSHVEINDRLARLGEDYLRAYRTLKSLGEVITRKKLIEKVDEKNNVVNKKNISLLKFIEDYIKNAEYKVSHGTIRSYKTTQSLIIRLQKHRNQRIEFNDVTVDFYDEYIRYQNKILNYSANTVGKNVKNLKVFMKEASERGLNNNFEYLKKSFKVPKEEIDNIYLSEAELQELFDLDLSEDPRMERARDLFIVGCYTGLRFSDFSQIKKENIRNGLFTVRTEKTNHLVAIPIHPLIEAVMAKYKGLYTNSLPPAFANQVMNDYLKLIGEKAKFFEDTLIKKTIGGKKTEQSFQKFQLMTTHTARRSFATNLFLQGFPAISIMKITGHRSERNFMTYIKMTPHENAEKLRIHWENLHKERAEALAAKEAKKEIIQN